MIDLKEIPEFSKYFRIISPTKIEVKKEEIFYRDKYNEIINYIKAMATYNSDGLLGEYLSPKGAILINANPGTDIMDFIKLIASNYYLELIEFNYNEIRKAPDNFLKNFIPILRALGGHSRRKKEEISGKEDNEEDEVDTDRNIEKRLLLINQPVEINTLFKGKNLLEIFFNEQGEDIFNFMESNILVIWINYNIQDILNCTSNIYDSFDLFIKIQLLNNIERETILRDFLEKTPNIVFDINALVDFTDNWEVIDIKKIVQVGIMKQFLNSELNETSNEITQILLDLIETGEYIPTINQNIPKVQLIQQDNEVLSNNLDTNSKKERSNHNEPIVLDNYLNNIRGSRISDFMLNQLYEDAAFRNYSELVIIIDKLDKKEPLEENDRKMIANYPFILNDSPNMAQINLEKAKKRVDRIKHTFGK
ncbi:MAG: hypothetical protein ACW972_01195 [Promethearchaeota archaeon]|jgi:hypothetical protein